MHKPTSRPAISGTSVIARAGAVLVVLMVVGLAFLWVMIEPAPRPDMVGKAARAELTPCEAPPEPVEFAATAPPQPAPAPPPASGPATGGFITFLTNPAADPHFQASTHRNDSGFYGGHWRPENIRRVADGARLEVRRIAGETVPFTMAEMKTGTHYGFGRYEVIMQPAKGSGLVSAFFTYTGPWQGNPHDEIDIEFLGKDTTRIHFNYFSNGRRGDHAIFDLPFDAAAAPRLYAFEWTPDRIVWFVENTPYYATTATGAKRPGNKQMVFLSTWTGRKLEGWHGPATFASGAGAVFSCVSFQPLGQATPQCSDTYYENRLTKGP